MPKDKITDGTKVQLLRTYPTENEVTKLGYKVCQKIAKEAINKAYIESIEVNFKKE